MKLSDKLPDLTKWALQTFEDTVPEDILNNARKSGEALCKTVLLKHYGDETGIKIIRGQVKRDGSIIPARNPKELNFETLINHVVTDENDYIIIKNRNIRSKTRSNLSVIQAYANPASHDSNSSESRSDLGDARVAKFILTELIIWLYEEYLGEPLPELLVQHVSAARSKYVEGDEKGNCYEDLRGLDIVKLCYPRQKIVVETNYSDTRRKISYEFIAVEVARNNIIGHLFVKGKITIDNTLQHFIENLKVELSSLKLCSPRIMNSETGKQIDRMRGIKEKFTDLANEQLHARTEYFLIDDFVWQYCLSQDAEKLNLHVDQEQYFIDQELFQIKDKERIQPQPSLSFVEELLESSEKRNPINIIVGRGGVGKTTFCEQAVSLINSRHQRKALLISSTDLRNVPPDSEVSSVTDLYRLFALEVKHTEANDVLEPNNLEINISCGNIILIIDGLDEIESTLGSNFNLDHFLKSAISLNEAHRRCSIVITSRDYYLDRYVQRDSVNKFELLGFSSELVDKYLEKRLSSSSQIKKARRYIAGFHIAENDRHTPLYLALISDLLEREELFEDEPNFELSESDYYHHCFPLDNLVYQLLRREIVKQSLDITCDEYFKLIAEISVEHKGSISKKDLNEYIEYSFSFEATAHNESEKYKQIYVSPILAVGENSQTFRIKYDFMEIWIQARLFFFNYKNGNCPNSMQNLFAELYDGSSPLLEELLRMKAAIQFEYLEKGKNMLKELIKIYRSSQDNRQIYLARKSISGLLYFCLSENTGKNKSDNSDILIHLFGTNRLSNVCIFGKFFPLDFTTIEVHEGWFERYESFDKCKFPENEGVFYDSTFKDINPKINMASNTKLFDNCRLSDELKRAVVDGKGSIGNLYSRIRDDLTRILKVGFSRNRFSWKSHGIYKTEASPKDFPLDKYLKFLMIKGVLIKILNKSGSGHGFEVSEHFKDSAKNLITNSIVKPQMEIIIREAMKEFYDIKT